MTQNLHDALQKFAENKHILIALDFDGTLAPFVANAEEARMSEENATTLKKLSQLPDTDLALVSGRNVESLIATAKPEDNYYLIGSHGAEMSFSNEGPELSKEQQQLLADITKAVEKTSAEIPGSKVEYKPAAVVFHYREVDENKADEVQKAIDGLNDQFPMLHSMAGNKVEEFAILSLTKGDGIKAIRKHLNVDAILFIGDDVTDENGFKELSDNDIGIKVGEGETKAAYRIADTDAVTETIAELLKLREAVTAKNS
ncbi:MAG: trehalose-phosphatase [Micrococcaceae bacterium]